MVWMLQTQLSGSQTWTLHVCVQNKWPRPGGTGQCGGKSWVAENEVWWDKSPTYQEHDHCVWTSGGNFQKKWVRYRDSLTQYLELISRGLRIFTGCRLQMVWAQPVDTEPREVSSSYLHSKSLQSSLIKLLLAALNDKIGGMWIRSVITGCRTCAGGDNLLNVELKMRKVGKEDMGAAMFGVFPSLRVWVSIMAGILALQRSRLLETTSPGDTFEVEAIHSA